MTEIGVYHGDEEWVLKGIAQDLANSLEKVKSISVLRTDQVFKGKRLDAEYHIFVQQGQLNKNCLNKKENVPDGTICLFTHLDITNFRPDILSKCKAVIFNSSIQLSMAIANGYNPKNAYLKPHAVNPKFHRIMKFDSPDMLHIIEQLRQSGCNLESRSSVGFCGRYWSKATYTRRKNYSKIKKVVYELADLKIPVVILGPGWEKLITQKSPFIFLINSSYKYYPVFYNLMRIFVSLSVHEGGPLPILESMCCGAYPIVTNTGFSLDVLRDQSDGIILDPFKPSSFYTEVIKSQFYSDHWNIYAIRKQASQYSFDALAALIVKICNLK
ncbi:glycosyltransferase [Synechococcus sp. CC9616]|uniref:glycosyltransferase n=1 Tax=Synechococcus sp. CC9616 TaxID=110663 RepID=UPI0004BA72B4|nr:glycosyltransferase [Synechococcus sp. CC9616]